MKRLAARTPSAERVPVKAPSSNLDVVAQQGEMVDAAVIAYVDWRAQCTAVRAAYRSWAHAPTVDAELAYLAYGAALDREQAAADVYAGLMREVGHLVESGLDYPVNPSSR